MPSYGSFAEKHMFKIWGSNETGRNQNSVTSNQNIVTSKSRDLPMEKSNPILSKVLFIASNNHCDHSTLHQEREFEIEKG